MTCLPMAHGHWLGGAQLAPPWWMPCTSIGPFGNDPKYAITCFNATTTSVLLAYIEYIKVTIAKEV